MTKKPRITKTGTDTMILRGDLYFEDCRQCAVNDEVFKEIIGDGYTKSIRVISLDTQWLLNVHLSPGVKITEQINMEMTLRRELRSERGHWYAYRRVAGTLYKRYVGTDDAITQERLLAIAQKMPSL